MSKINNKISNINSNMKSLLYREPIDLDNIFPNFYYPKQNHRMALLPSIIITVSGIIIMIKMKDLNIPKLFEDGIFSIKFFESLKYFYKLSHF